MRSSLFFLVWGAIGLLTLPFGATRAQAETDSDGIGAATSESSDNVLPIRTLETEIIRMTNEQRHHFGLPTLVPHQPLYQAARQHSQEMLRLNYFRHESPVPENSSPLLRVMHTGTHTELVAENIFTADGYPLREVGETCLESWMESPGHRANILSQKYNYAGVGIAIHSIGGEPRVMVTEVFCNTISH